MNLPKKIKEFVAKGQASCVKKVREKFAKK